MSLIPGSQLRWISKVFGLSGQQRAGVTNLDDGDVTQVLEVGQLARRGDEPFVHGSLFFGVLENVHSGADAEISNIQPYAPAASAINNFPPIVADEYDIWLFGVAGIRSSGAGGLTGALLNFNPSAFQQGWGDDDQGAPVVAANQFAVALFDDLDETISSQAVMITEAGQPFVPLNLRVPRGTTFVFHSEAAAAAEFQLILHMGMFPVGLGQDGVG